MSKIGIKAKLAGGFGALLLILVATAILTYHSVGEISESSTTADHRATLEEAVQETQISTLKVGSSVRDYLLTGKDAALETYEEGRREYKAGVEKLVPQIKNRGDEAVVCGGGAHG